MATPYNILYVDDEPHNLVAFSASFRRHYVIFTAGSGTEALHLMRTQTERNQPIHLIISDQRMPEMTGVELLEQLLTEFPDTIRMVLTAYSDLESAINAINKGKVYQFINKPWNTDELRMTLDNALQYYHLKIENRALQEERTRLLIRAERQEKEAIRSRFETLKNQVNPHFLFNSLNALASLVHKNPDAAREFIQKLSDVYRYIIDQRDAELVDLREELQFMRAYFFLHKIRFGDNLHLVERGLTGPQLHAGTPPLALQLLVENAIKHNIVSSEQPLTIEVYAEGEYLVVRNNFQPRTGGAPGVVSTGIGHQNLRERYGFLSDCGPDFYQERGYFYAKLPLLRRG